MGAVRGNDIAFREPRTIVDSWIPFKHSVIIVSPSQQRSSLTTHRPSAFPLAREFFSDFEEDVSSGFEVGGSIFSGGTADDDGLFLRFYCSESPSDLLQT